jgi:hypothetical protein
MPDCSNEGAPLPAGTVNLHRAATDNVGLPWLAAAPADTRRGAAGLSDKPNDVLIHTYRGSNFMVTVRQVNPGQVYLDNVSRAATYTGSGGRIWISKMNLATNTVEWEGFADDGGGTCSLPKIVVGLSGTYSVTYKYSTTAGDQIRATRFSHNSINAPLPQILASLSLCGTNTYSNIREYDVDADNNYGFGVIARNYNASTGNSSILAQYVDLFFGNTWNLADFLTVNTGTAVPLTNNTASAKWNPLIRWNFIRGNYILAWGDQFVNPNPVMAQEISTAGALSYPVGGGPIWSATLTTNREFYMEPCKGYIFGGVDQGLTFLHYADNAGNLQLRGYLLNGGTGLLVNNTGAGVTALPAGTPMALHAYTVSGTREDPCAMYTSAAGVQVRRGDATGILPSGTWTSAAIANPASARFASFLSSNTNGLFAAIPDNGQEILRRLNSGTGAWSAATNVNTRNYPPVGAETDAYFAACLDGNRFGLSQYEYGFALPWVAARFALDDQETAENHREEGLRNTTYSWRTYTTTGIAPYYTGALSGEIESYQIHFAAYTDLLDNERATVYESWNRNSTCDVKMMYRNSTTGLDMPLTVALSTSSLSYTNPKVSISNSPLYGVYIAIITYIKEDNLANQGYYCYKVVDLSTGGTLVAETVINNGVVMGGPGTFRNDAVVHDQALNCHHFIFWKQAALGPPATFEILDAGFDADGVPLPWLPYPNIVRAASITSKEEIRACENPDVSGGLTTSGAYVTWLEDVSPFATVNLTAVRTLTGANWGAGTIIHTPALANDRGQPVVTADANCVFVAWRDTQLGAGRNHIYGAAWDNTGVIMPGGWTINGVDLTTFIPSAYTAFGYDAVMPDVAMPTGYFQPTVALVFAESEGNSLLFPQRIGCLTVNLATLGIAGQNHFAFAARNYPASMASSDAVEAMHGFFQRRPKVVAMTRATTLVDGYIPPRPFLMCAFETEAYPITNPAYSAIAAMETSRQGAPGFEPAWCENSIAAVYYEPNSGIMASKFSIARKSQAQDLDQLLYTEDQGFVAAYTDYLGGNSYAGIAKAVDVKEEIRDYHYFDNNPLVPGDEYNINWTTNNQTEVFRLYNNSIIDLVVNLSARSTTTQVPSPYVTWQLNGLSLSNDMTISGDEIGTTRDVNASMTYLPGGPVTTNNDDVDVLVYPHQFSVAWFYKEMPIYGPLGTGSYKIAGGESPKTSGSLQLSLSQNPASLQTTATLVGLSDHNVNLRLYDMLGRELLGLQPLVMTGAALNEQIRLGQLSSGRYILVADQDTGDRVQMMLSVEH